MAEEGKFRGRPPQMAQSGMKKVAPLKEVKHKIFILSGKGGVGKTTVAANLALLLSMNGSEVGLLDVDIHGPNIPKMLGIENERLSGDEKKIFPVLVPPHLKVVSMAFLISNRDAPVIWRGPLKMKAIDQFLNDVAWGKLDYLVIDLPPGTGDEPLSIAQNIPDADGGIVVTTPQDVALLDSRKAINFVRALQIPVLGVIENMSGLICPHCGKEIDLFKTGGGEKAAKDMNVSFLGRIPIDPKIVETGDSGVPVVMSYSDSEGAKAFSKIVKKIEDILRSGRNHESSK